MKMMRRIVLALSIALLAIAPAHADTYVFRPAAPYAQNAIVTPPQWDETNNSVTCIGAGGGGASGQSASTGGSGGGGGAAATKANAHFEGWLSANWQTGQAGGTPGNPAGSQSGSNTEITAYYGGGDGCGAFGGNGGNGTTIGTGGGVSYGSGFSGGNGGLGGADTGGGACGSPPCGGGGGGGAAGASGAGGNGAKFTGATGGAGGQGDNATGGAGGAAGAAGADGTETGGYGSGGGGGGGTQGASAGGAGGKCGGGGAGGGDNTKAGGNGQDSCIIFTYTPTNDQNLGYSGANSSTHTDSQNLECNSWTAPITGVGQTVFYSLQSSLTGNLVIGVYDSDSTADLPLFAGSPLVQTAQITNPTSGLHSQAFTSSLSATRGHLYWMCFLANATIAWNGSANSGTDLDYHMSYSTTLPNMKSTVWSDRGQDTHQKIYVPLFVAATGTGGGLLFLGNWR